MKLNGSKKLMGGLALAGAFALTGVVGVAQQQSNQGQDGRERGGREWRHKGGKEGREGGFAGRFFERLNLTDAQKEQMQQIAARHRESTKALRQQMRQARQGAGDNGIFNGGTFNESAVRANAQARANAHVEMEVMRARIMSEMYAVLTPEQKTQIATERQQREQKRQERRARRGANTDQNQ